MKDKEYQGQRVINSLAWDSEEAKELMFQVQYIGKVRQDIIIDGDNKRLLICEVK